MKQGPSLIEELAQSNFVLINRFNKTTDGQEESIFNLKAYYGCVKVKADVKCDEDPEPVSAIIAKMEAIC